MQELLTHYGRKGAVAEFANNFQTNPTTQKIVLGGLQAMEQFLRIERFLETRHWFAFVFHIIAQIGAAVVSERQSMFVKIFRQFQVCIFHGIPQSIPQAQPISCVNRGANSQYVRFLPQRSVSAIFSMTHIHGT